MGRDSAELPLNSCFGSSTLIPWYSSAFSGLSFELIVTDWSLIYTLRKGLFQITLV
jgi:hypothetical protein